MKKIIILIIALLLLLFCIAYCAIFTGTEMDIISFRHSKDNLRLIYFSKRVLLFPSFGPFGWSFYYFHPSIHSFEFSINNNKISDQKIKFNIDNEYGFIQFISESDGKIFYRDVETKYLFDIRNGNRSIENNDYKSLFFPHNYYLKYYADDLAKGKKLAYMMKGNSPIRSIEVLNGLQNTSHVIGYDSEKDTIFYYTIVQKGQDFKSNVKFYRTRKEINFSDLCFSIYFDSQIKLIQCWKSEDSLYSIWLSIGKATLYLFKNNRLIHGAQIPQKVTVDMPFSTMCDNRFYFSDDLSPCSIWEWDYENKTFSKIITFWNRFATPEILEKNYIPYKEETVW